MASTDGVLEVLGTLSNIRKVIDIGCGDGYALDRFKGLGFEATGVTNNEAGASLCRSRGHEVVVHDAHDLGSLFHDEFDLVYCRQTLEHLYSPYLALCAMNEILKPDGYLLIALPDASWTEWGDHLYVLNERQVINLLTKTGFRPVREKWDVRNGNLVDECYLARKAVRACEVKFGY